MSDFQNLLLAVLEKRPLRQGQASYAQMLRNSKNAFERLVGTLAIRLTHETLRIEAVHDQLMQYAQQVLFKLFSIRSSSAVQRPRIKKFVFKAARCGTDSDRLNATHILAEIAKKEKTAYRILEKLKDDPDAWVAHSAKIFLGELSQTKSFPLET
jgi:HEAT repeat protein